MFASKEKRCLLSLWLGFLAGLQIATGRQLQVGRPHIVSKNETVSLQCKTPNTDGNECVWYFSEEANKTHVSNSNCELQIQNIQPEQAGRYECCWKQYIEGMLCTSTTLFVIEFFDCPISIVKVLPKFVRLNMNRHKSTTLIVNHGVFDFKLALHYDSENRTIKEESKYNETTRTKYLIVAKATEAGGRYRLTATTNHFTDSYRIYASFGESMAQITHGYGSGIVVKNSDVLLQCSLGEYENSLLFNITWYFEQRIISSFKYNWQNQTETELIQYNIINIQGDGAGVYSCCISGSNSNTNPNCALINIYVLDTTEVLSFTPNSDNVTGVVRTTSTLNATITLHYGSSTSDLNMVNILPDRNDTTSFIIDRQQKHVKTSFVNLQKIDSGWYTIQADSKGVKESYKLLLLVDTTGTPEPTMDNVTALVDDEFVQVVCHGLSYTKPDVELQFIPCHNHSWDTNDACSNLKASPINVTDILMTSANEFRAVGRIMGPFKSKGIVECVATSSEGTAKASSILTPRPFHGDMVLQVVPSIDTITDQVDKALIECRVVMYDFSGDFILTSNDRSFPAWGYLDKFAWVANMTIQNVVDNDVTCQARRYNGSILKRSLKININLSPEEHFEGFNISYDRADIKSSTTSQSKVSWYRNNVSIENDALNTVLYPGEKHVVYTCTIENVDWFVSKSWKILARSSGSEYSKSEKAGARSSESEYSKSEKIGAKSSESLLDSYNFDWRMLVIGTLAAAVVLLGAIAFVFNHKRNASDLSNSYNVVELMKDVLPIEYEFTKEQLKFGRKLGEGEYGIVLLAQATNILEDEPITTVAVKKPKNHKNNIDVRMLVSELKIMIEVGQHVNVVNLLGAVQPVARKQELMTIMEYCEYGNLLDFIRNNKSNFADFKDILDAGWAAQENELSNRPRGASKAIPFQTNDLVWWSAQIAHGMMFLASKNVVHSDLAARNVLLSAQNVAKVSDFGLARTLHRTACYKKKGNDPMPIKWLAIESLSKGLFNEKSDVWAYGILLWELYSLGCSPYPSVDVNELYDLLMRGYRMDRPDYASEEIYDIMMKCWFSNRKLRPTFEELVAAFNEMIPSEQQQEYDALNKPRLLTNSKGYFRNNKLSILPKFKFYV